MRLFDAVRALWQPKSEVRDDLSGDYFPAAAGISGRISALSSVACSHLGPPIVAPSPLAGYLLRFREADGTWQRAVLTPEGREQVLQDFRRQELEHGRVVRFPKLG